MSPSVEQLANPRLRSERTEIMLGSFAAAWNARSGAGVADAFTEDGVRHEFAMPGARLEGRRAIADHVQEYMDAIPDCTLIIRSVGETSGGRAMLEWTFSGTHLHDLPGLPAQGEEISLDGISICDMEGTLIREEHVYWDAATLFAGAGVLG